MRARSAARVTHPPDLDVPPLENGDHLDQPTFHRLYEQTPDGFKAELIGGIVYVASPTHQRHGRPHARAVYWLTLYMDETPGLDVLDNTTSILAEDSEPQPDACLLIQNSYGGQTSDDEDGCLVGAAELVTEVALSSVAIDLHAKKRDYEKAGVQEYVVAMAGPKQVVWFTRGKKGFTELSADADGILRSKVFPGLWLDPAALFERTTHRLRAVLRQGLATPEHAAFVKKLEAKRAALAKKKPKPDA